MNELLSAIDSFDSIASNIANPENGGGGDGGKVKCRSKYLDTCSCLPGFGSMCRVIEGRGMEIGSYFW